MHKWLALSPELHKDQHHSEIIKLLFSETKRPIWGKLNIFC